jgi:exonuclease V
MSGPLEKYGRNHLKVTELSQQFWCERQVALSLEHPREETEEMASGSEIHKDLMLELVDEVPVTLQTAEDELYLLMLNVRTGLEQLLNEGKTRELYVFGRAGTFPVAGIIDEISLEHGELTLLDHKTRTRPTLPPPPSFLTTEVQVMTYRKMLDDLREGRYTFDDFKQDRGLDGTGDISPDFRAQLEAEELYESVSPAELAQDVFRKFRQLPPLSDYIIIRYLHQGSGDHIGDKVVLYDPDVIGQKLVHALKFWNGEREARGVGSRERWKCNYCEYKGVQCKE